MPITKTDKIWMNGSMISWDDAKIHLLTHALHYGSGVFEGIRCYKTVKGPAIFRHREHMERLENSGKIYYMELPYTIDELMEACRELIKANKLDECYIRPIAYRGYGEMGLNPLNAVVDVAIAAWPWGTYLGEEGLKRGIRVKISSIERISSNVMPPAAKATGQYINSILAKVEALKAGYDEAVMMDKRGMISEGPGENIFLVKNGMLFTPPSHASILPGITRDSLIQIAGDNDIPVCMTDIDRGMLLQADELFFTGTAAEVTPIREVDGIEIGKPGQITKKLQAKFFDIVKGKNKEYDGWLDYVK
ncbi:MAG: branched-chain amino acid transaminase [Candidatus Altiarchaeota archaeon]